MTNTNKKAIEILKKNRPSWGTRECDRELCWAVDTAIDVLNAFENLGAFITKFANSYDYALVPKDVWRDAKKALEKQMSQPKTGHWKYYQNEKGDWINECSVCGSDAGVGYQYPYCPNCGCRMVEPQESEVENGNDRN